MSTHNHESGHEPEEIDASAGYEQADVRVTGIVVFLTALAIFVAVTGALCYGIGMMINAHMAKVDGPTTKWQKDKTVDVRGLGNLANSPALQNKMAELTRQFPTPRLQTDDGNQEIADLHAKEDLLMNNYSWVDGPQGSPRRVRIPIDKAIELLAQRGLPVTPAVVQAPLMTGDIKPVVATPLTNGFARTGYEHDLAVAESVEAKRAEPVK
ncbi:MAG TPA: hypothetical protein VN776_07755 [Terracidiphilus sp.]|nr:hypothetical protein [Terracidiphilus sp.]